MAHSDARGFDRGEDAVGGQGFRATGGSRPAPSPESGADSLGALLTGLIKDIQDLVRGELRLAKTELKVDASAAGKAIGYLVAGGLMGVVAVVFIALAVAALLDKWMQTWIAVAIVAAALTLIAAILAMTGKSKLSAGNLRPDQTIDSLKEDQEWARQQINSVKR